MKQVMAALRTVQDPELFKDIVTLNMVKDVRVDGDDVDGARRADHARLPAEGRDRARRRPRRCASAGAEQRQLNLTANTRGAPTGGARTTCCRR